MKVRRPLLRFIAASIGLPVLWLAAQSTSTSGPREQMIGYLDEIANSYLGVRSYNMIFINPGVRLVDTANRKKAWVREKILRLIGGLPEHKGPVAVKEFGTVAADGFRVEKI